MNTTAKTTIVYKRLRGESWSFMDVLSSDVARKLRQLDRDGYICRVATDRDYL